MDTPEAIDLVKKLMTLKPQARLSAAETLMHPWMQDQAVIDRAEALMKTQRRETETETETETEANGNGTFKRPMTESASSVGGACKRSRMTNAAE